MMTFPEALAEILKKRQMSASIAAVELGYSSKTALLRILNGESKPSSYRKCFEAAQSSGVIALTQEECSLLERALQVSTLGKKIIVINDLLRTLLFPKKIDDGPAMQPIEGIRQISTFEQLLARISELKEIHIRIFGKCAPALLSRLSRLTKTADIKGIDHVISVKVNEPDDYRAVGETAHILFNIKYSLYTYLGQDRESNNWSFHSGIIIITGMSGSGRQHTYLLLPLKNDRYYCIHENSDSHLNLMNRILEDAKSSIHPIKINRSYMSDPFPLNYMQFIDEYRRIEYNREILTVKPDLPFFCIPPDILHAAVLEGFSAVSTFSPEDSVITRLYDIQKSRYDNLLKKKKDTHIVLSREAMECFARTGRRKDHFYLVRPYTPQERVSILSALLENMLTMPHFHIWFNSNPSIVLDKEITSYENYALSIVDAETTWDIGGDHQEVLLETRTIASCFSDYYHQHLLKNDVFPRETSIEIIRNLIRIARSCAE